MRTRNALSSCMSEHCGVPTWERGAGAACLEVVPVQGHGARWRVAFAGWGRSWAVVVTAVM
jgi:hypothetical protein